MHNIKLIRDKKNYFEKKFKDRNLNINLDDLLSLDKKNRELIQKKEKLEQEKKIISKSKDKSKFEQSKKISVKIESLETSQFKISNEIKKIIDILPNVALEDVPVGTDEKKKKQRIKQTWRS